MHEKSKLNVVNQKKIVEQCVRKILGCVRKSFKLCKKTVLAEEKVRSCVLCKKKIKLCEKKKFKNV